MEKKDVEQKLIENKSHISDHISISPKMLSEIAKKFVQSDLDLLISIEYTHNRYKNLKSSRSLFLIN